MAMWQAVWASLTDLGCSTQRAVSHSSMAQLKHPNSVATTSSESDTFTGWTLGGGLEYLVSPGWSVKAEYQYFDFGTQHSSVDYLGTTFRFDHELTAQTVKAGLNLHMYSSYQPLN